MPKLRPDQYLSCVLFLIVSFFVPISSPIEAKELKPITKLQPLPLLAENFKYPVKKTELVPAPRLTAKAAIVYDVTNGAIIFDKSVDEQLPEASLTKLMTALVSIDLYSLDDQVTINHDEFTTENNVMGLRPNEVITVGNLLKGLLIFSANDAALALSNHHPQGSEAFIAAMNTKAKELHLEHTSFQNSPGFDDQNHHSTAFDLAILAKEVLSHPQLSDIMQTQTTTVTDVTETIDHPLHSTNLLLNKLSGVIAGKTGSTPLAGECLITEVVREEHPIITVVLGSQDRFNDTSILVDWVYNYFEWRPPVQTDITTQ
ncbi:MAG: hypothetical protein ABI425_01630 [Patescibacteria group bacterium]